MSDLFFDHVQDLVDRKETEINIWYLGEGNIAGEKSSVLKDSKNDLTI